MVNVAKIIDNYQFINKKRMILGIPAQIGLKTRHRCYRKCDDYCDFPAIYRWG
jgi:hypothetical protein